MPNIAMLISLVGSKSKLAIRASSLETKKLFEGKEIFMSGKWTTIWRVFTRDHNMFIDVLKTKFMIKLVAISEFVAPKILSSFSEIYCKLAIKMSYCEKLTIESCLLR